MEDNKLIRLDERFSREDLGSLTNEELFKELEKTYKIYNSLINRSVSLMHRIYGGTYKPQSDELFNQGVNLRKLQDKLADYVSIVRKEVGKRLNLSKKRIKEIGEEVYQELDF